MTGASATDRTAALLERLRLLGIRLAHSLRPTDKRRTGNGRRAESAHRTSPIDDAPLVAQLTAWHATFNAERFGGALTTPRLRVSRRMKTRLGHYSPKQRGRGPEIAISWRHLRRHGAGEAAHTLLHEMVHQWQHENGLPLDHGMTFRKKAREVGVLPRARRRID